MIFAATGEPLTPTHASKAGRRYRYYVSRSLLDGAVSGRGEGATGASPSWRIPAAEIENLVVTALSDLLSDGAGLVERLRLAQLDTPHLHRVLVAARAHADHLRAPTDPDGRNLLRSILQRVEAGPEAVAIRFDTEALMDWIHPGLAETIERDPAALVLKIPVRLKRRGAELKLVLTDRQQPTRRDRSLINALARGFGWFEELRTGAAPSLGAIAERENVSPNLVRRYIDLAVLPTDLIDAIIAGQQPVELTAESIKQAYPLPVRWREQSEAVELRRSWAEARKLNELASEVPYNIR